MTPGEIQARYKDDPLGFFVDVLDVDEGHLWSKMKEISESVRDHQFTAVKAGNSLSKSYSAARIALWFLYTHYPSTVVTTAPSQSQVEDILWREIASAHGNARVALGGQVLKTSLDLQRENATDKWFAVGFATRPDTVTQQATRMQGFHNHNVLIILDEAAGVMPEIWLSVYKLTTTPRQKLLAIGNPTTASGDFVQCFKDKRFNKVTVSVFDSPNYKAGRELIPGLSGREFVEFVKAKWGEASNYYKAMVTGDIPDEDVDSLIPVSWVEAAENREVKHWFGYTKRFVTWDVADGGDDPHIIKAWDNKTEIDHVEVRGKKVEEVEPKVWQVLRRVKGNAIIVDADGIGRVALSLLEQSKDKATTIIPFAGSDTNVKEPQFFANRRHEGHWAMRDDFEKGMISISAIPEQREELCATKLVTHRKGFIAIEKKEEIKKRLGRSPDHSDAIMMMSACFDEVPVSEKKERRAHRWWKFMEPEYEFNPMTV